MKERVAYLVLALAASLWMVEPSFAITASKDIDSDCHALKLKDASGVGVGKIHDYEFVGTCNIIVTTTITSDGIVPGTKSSDKHTNVHTMPAVARGHWDGSTFEFKETFNVVGGLDSGTLHVGPGPVSSIFKCNFDPLVYPAACKNISHSNQSGLDAFSNPALKQRRPLLKGKTTLAEAEALSKKHGIPVPTTPWPKYPSSK